MGFRELPLSARRYILTVYGLTVAAVGLAFAASFSRLTEHGLALGQPAERVWAFAALLVAAAVAHSFPVSAPGRQAFHVSLPFFLAAALLLEPLQLAVVLVVANGAEWVRRQWSWFAHLFNIASYVLSGVVAQAANQLVGAALGAPRTNLGEPGFLLTGLVAAAAFAATNRLLVSVVIWLTNGIPPARQQMFDPESLLTDGILLVMGIPLAWLGQTSPWMMVFGALPLVLVHRALDLPNLRSQRRTDAITELSSVSAFLDACRRELSRSERFGRPVALVLIDVDHLGRVNADRGYQEGDAVIDATSALVARATRDYDLAARVLGGEFALLLPETDATGALTVGERIRSSVAAHSFTTLTSVEPLDITVSIGVASALSTGPAAEELLASAREALAQAKRRGRDQVVLAPRLAGRSKPIAKPDDTLESSPTLSLPTSGVDPPPEPENRADGAYVKEPEPETCRPRVKAGQGSAAAAVAFALVVATLALAVVAFAAGQLQTVDPITLTLLVGLVAVAELRSMELFERSAYSISAVPVLASAILLGVPGAVLVAGSVMLFRAAVYRMRWYKLAFNVGLQILTAAAAAAVYGASAASLDELAILRPVGLTVLVIPALLAGLVNFLHTVLVAMAMALELKERPLGVWNEHFRWLWPQYAVLTMMAFLFALAYEQFGLFGAAAFVVPPLMMRAVAKQYIERTSGNVRQLRALNVELSEQIEQRIAAEEEMARLAREAASLEAAEEVARIRGELVSVVSHEMRTPLGSLMGFTELLLTRNLSEDERRECLTLMQHEGQRLSALINDFLDLQRMESDQRGLNPAPTDLGSVTCRVVKTLGDEPDRPLIVALPEHMAKVLADEARLEQVLVNLLSNARKYSPDGGQIRVSAQHVGEFVEVVVEDRGLGVPADAIPHVFDKFYRVDNSDRRMIQGTGLGLAIVKQIVEAHGGQVWAESDGLGCGSRFCFTLPMAKSEAPPMMEETPDSEARAA